MYEELVGNLKQISYQIMIIFEHFHSSLLNRGGWWFKLTHPATMLAFYAHIPVEYITTNSIRKKGLNVISSDSNLAVL